MTPTLPGRHTKSISCKSRRLSRRLGRGKGSVIPDRRGTHTLELTNPTPVSPFWLLDAAASCASPALFGGELPLGSDDVSLATALSPRPADDVPV
jgi:hypothetical protein